MSETSHPQNPESHRRHIDGVPEGLQLDKLDDLVGLRAELAQRYEDNVRLLKSRGSSEPSLTFEQYFKLQLEQRMKHQGIEEGDTDETKADYEFAEGVYAMVAGYDRKKWLTAREGHKMPRRNEVFQSLVDWSKQRQRAVQQDDANEAHAEPIPIERRLNDDERAEAGEMFDKTRDHYAGLLVERTQKLFEMSKGRVDAEHTPEQIKNIDQAREDFGDYLSAMATEMALEYREQGLPLDQYADKIDEFIQEQTEKFISTFEEMRADIYKKRPSIIQKGLDKWASWSTNQDPNQSFLQRIISKENFKNNLKKAAVFAVPSFLVGAAVGAVAAPVVAAVGAGAVVGVGIGAWIGRGLARNVVTHKLDSTANSFTIAEKQAQDMRLLNEDSQARYEEVLQYEGVDLDTLKDTFNGSEEEFEEFKVRVEKGRIEFAGKAAHEAILGLIDERTDAYRKQNRNRFLAGTAISVVSGALGGLVGGFIASQFSAPRISGGQPFNSAKPSPSAQPTVTPGGSAQASPSPSPSGSTPTEAPTQPNNPNDPNNPNSNNGKAPAFKIVGADERHISGGEGWYETFREMGVGAKHRADLLEEVGPKLEKMGLAYKYGSEWRMNMTENGELPKAAIKLIAETAHEHNWQTDYDKFFEASTDNGMNDTLHDAISEYAEGRNETVIEPGEGGLEFMRELGIDAPDRQAAWDDIAPKLDDKLTYRMPDGEWRLNMTPDHQMPISAIETAVETAQENGIHTDYTSIIEQASEATADHLDANDSFTATELGTYSNDKKAYFDALAGVNPAHKGDVLKAAAYELQSFRLTEKVDGVWRFREVNTLPPKAIELLSRIATKNHWTLTA